MYIIIIHNDIKWPILCHNSQTQITSLTFANYHHIMCSAKLAGDTLIWLLFSCVLLFFWARKLARVNLFTFRWHIVKNWGENEKRERERGEKKNTEEKALNGDLVDNALAALTRDQSVWYPLCLAVPGADIDKEMETQLKNHIVPLSRRWKLDNQKTKIRRVYQPNYILNKFLIKQILQEIRWLLGNLIGYYYLSVRVDVKVFWTIKLFCHSAIFRSRKIHWKSDECWTR